MSREASVETYVAVLEDLLAAANLRVARLEAVLREREKPDEAVDPP